MSSCELEKPEALSRPTLLQDYSPTVPEMRMRVMMMIINEIIKVAILSSKLTLPEMMMMIVITVSKMSGYSVY